MAPGTDGASAPRAIHADVTLASAAETLLFNAVIGFLDLEWVQVRFVAGALPNTIQFRDRQGGAVFFTIPLSIGLAHDFFERVHRIEQRTGHAAWSVQLSGAGTTIQVLAQARPSSKKH